MKKGLITWIKKRLAAQSKSKKDKKKTVFERIDRDMYNVTYNEALLEVKQFYENQLNDYNKSKDIQMRLRLGLYVSHEDAQKVGIIQI